MAIAWSRISSKVIAHPPPLWRLGPGSAMSVTMGLIRNAHREYTRNLAEWQAKVPRAAGPLTWGRSGSRWNVSETGTWPVALGYRGKSYPKWPVHDHWRPWAMSRWLTTPEEHQMCEGAPPVGPVVRFDRSTCSLGLD